MNIGNTVDFRFYGIEGGEKEFYKIEINARDFIIIGTKKFLRKIESRLYNTLFYWFLVF